MSRELILVIAAILSLVLIVYTIGKVDKLNITRTYKGVLIFVTVLFPILGFLLVRVRKNN